MPSFIAGKYNSTQNSVDLGEMAEGFRLSMQRHSRIITGHSGAKTPQDGIHQGAEVFLSFTAIEAYKAQVLVAMWPLGTIFDCGIIGRLDTSMATQTVLTALAGTPAAASPASVTLPETILAEGYPVEMLFGPDLREAPIRFRAYPNSSNVFGTVT